MKKKSLITMLVALTLVAVVGVGATLAYLSSTTDELTNTFTVGNVKVVQDEKDIDGVPTPENPFPRTSEGNDYVDIEPGDVLDKDPTATVLANSSDCYVFMQLTGADALKDAQFEFIGFDSSKWIKVDNTGKLDGVYRYYQVVEKSTDNQKLDSLFTQVKYSLDATELEADEKLSDVVIKTCAVQADHMTEESAYDAAVKEINPEN